MEGTAIFFTLLLFGVIGTPINLASERRQYVSYPVGCDGHSIPCYSRLESACEMRHRINQPDWTKPVCNPDGSYREYQCEAYSRSKCWCVYVNGMMIPDTEKDLHDANVESSKLNCAEARMNAPPAPSPPPISAPFTDTRLGWHLAYRDAAYAYYKCPSPCYWPCPCKPGQHFYNPYYPASVIHPAPVPTPAPAPVAAPVLQPAPALTSAPWYYPFQAPATTYMGPYPVSCPDPCPDPCPCQRNGLAKTSGTDNKKTAKESKDEEGVTSDENKENED